MLWHKRRLGTSMTVKLERPGICTKVSYRSQAKARKALKAQSGARRGRKGTAIRAYLCPICRDYHLTSRKH